MIAVIVISLLALIAAALTVYLRQRTSSDAADNRVLPAPHFAGLFDRPGATPLVERRLDAIAARQSLLDLARSGDLNALIQAHSRHDAQLYADALDAMVEWAGDPQENLAALVSHVSKSDELRATFDPAKAAAERIASPSRSSSLLPYLFPLNPSPDIIPSLLSYRARGKINRERA